MRVLQINSFFTLGGPPRIMNGIYDTLVENGHECKIAAARGQMYVPYDSYRICSKYVVAMNALKARVLDNEGFNASCDTKKLVKFIKSYNPDIIHLHNLHGYVFNIEILFEYLKSIDTPIVWTLHDCWPFTGHCAYFTTVKCAQWKTECKQCVQLKSYPKCIGIGQVNNNFNIKRKLFSNINNIVFVTPSIWLSKFLKESFLGRYPIEVINNGISLEQFHYEKDDTKLNHFNINKKIILGVAQVWNERKGYFDFLKLADLLGSEYQVIMVGLSKKQKKDLPKNICGITKTNNIDELVALYSRADVFVNLTYEDNFPTVNIEALACGTPVITYNTGGSPEAIDSSCGWVINQGDLGGVVDVIHSLKEKQYYKSSCIERAQKFDRKARYKDYIDLYKDMLEERS